MSSRFLIAAVVGAGMLVSGAAARADAYRPGEFLMLDLNRAALSPKLLGPPAQFETLPIEAKSDAKANPVAAAPAAKRARVAAKPHGVASKKLARTRSNPLDANAADTRVQVWPCRSGGICSWRK